MEFVIPVYLTSFCQNECLYCGYRESNALAERVRLSLDEFGRELDLILSWGHRQIELVLSEDPEFGPEVVARYVELTRQKLDRLGGGVVGLCSPVYEREDYVRLRAAGLEWVVEWQETYHQPHFDRWHVVGSPKRDIEYRLDLWDRVIAAGIRKIALGALLGLYDWRYDALATDRARQLPAPRLWSGTARHRHSAPQARARRAGIAKGIALYGFATTTTV